MRSRGRFRNYIIIKLEPLSYLVIGGLDVAALVVGGFIRDPEVAECAI